MTRARPAPRAGSSPPGPPPMPLWGWRGNALRFFRNPVAYLSSLRKTHGNVASLIDRDHPTLFTQPTAQMGRTIFGFGPEMNKEILTQPDVFQVHCPRGPKTKTFERLSSNILFMNGQKHATQRRLLNPTFTREHLQSYHRDIVHYTEQMLGRWQDGQRIDVLREVNLLARSVASKALFGLEPSGESGTLSLTIRHVIDALFSPVTLIPLDLPGTPYRRLRLDMEKAEALIRFEIERRRSSGVGDDALMMMIKANDEEGNRLSPAELVSQAFVLFFAGHDTASSAICWTLFLLAQHPEVAAELHEELTARLGGAPPTYEQIYDLPVLDRVVKESLRVLGPGVFFPRVAVATTTLGPYEITAGSEVLYSPFVTHHDPDVYRDPDRFEPGRWLEIQPNGFEYLPFGAGPHRCIGASFGGMQMRTILATLVQRCRLEMVPGARIDVNVNVVMSPTILPMVVRRQDRQFHRSRAETGGYVRQIVDLG